MSSWHPLPTPPSACLRGIRHLDASESRERLTVVSPHTVALATIHSRSDERALSTKDSQPNLDGYKTPPTPPSEYGDAVDAVDAYPEGGPRAWLVVLGSFCGLVVSMGVMNSIGVYHAFVAHNQLRDYPESAIGWIFSVYIFFSLGLGVQIGPMFDHYGAQFLVLAGGVCLLVSAFLLSSCTEYWHFMLTFGVLMGAGSSLVFTPCIAAVGHWFSARRGNATGMAATGGAVGGVILPLLLRRLFTDVGWPWAVRVQGFLFIALLIPAVLLVRARLPRKRGGSVAPNFAILRQPRFATLTLGIYLMEWGLFVPIAYLPAYALGSGAFAPTFAFQLIAIFNAASALGRWLSGVLADRYGRFNLMLLNLATCFLASLALWLPATLLSARQHGAAAAPHTVQALTVAYATVMGFGSGSNTSLTPVCVSSLCDIADYGRYYSTCYVLVAVGTLTGVPIAGAILGRCGGDYWGVALFTVLNYAGALAAFAAVRVMSVGWKVKVWF